MLRIHRFLPSICPLARGYARAGQLTIEPDGTRDCERSGLPVRNSLFDDLNRYQATMHFNGQSTIVLDGDRATGECYCIAHHLSTDEGERKLMVAWLRYGDTFVKLGGAWLFAERNLYLDWSETRPSQP